MRHDVPRILIAASIALMLAACNTIIPLGEEATVGPRIVATPRATARATPDDQSGTATAQTPARSTPETSPTALTTAETAQPTTTPQLVANVINGGNVREGPSLQQPVLDQINANETVQLTGKTADSAWYQIINARGVQGWVSASLLQVDPSVAAQAPVTQATPEAAQANNTLPGWQAQKAGALQFAIPPSWRVLPLTKEDIASMATIMATDNPALAEVLNQLIETGQYETFSFFAANIRPQGGMTSSMNIVITPSDSSQPPRQLIETAIQELPEVVPGLQIIESDTDRIIGGRDGAQLIYDLPLVRPNGATITMRGVQFYILDAENTFVMTISGPPNDAFVAEADQIGASAMIRNQPIAAPTASATAAGRAGRVINGGNLRSEPRIAPETVVGQVCPQDQVEILTSQEPPVQGWSRIRITTTGTDCDSNRVAIGVEGWLSDTLLAP
jgi:hypothetical protein